MKQNKIKKTLGWFIGISLTGLVSSSLIVACTNNDKSNSKTDNKWYFENTKNNKQIPLKNNVSKYVEIDYSVFKNDQRFNYYNDDEIIANFIDRMSVKRKFAKTTIKTEFEISSDINEKAKTNDQFAYNGKNIFTTKPNEIPSWYYDSFFSQEPSKISELFYKTKLSNPKTTTHNNQERILSHFIRTEIFNRGTQRFQEIYFRTPLYVQGWYVTHPLYEYDLQNGQIREIFKVGEPKSENNEFKEIHLVAKYDGMKPAIAKKFNFIEYLHDSTEISENQSYDFEIEIKNKNNPLIKQKKQFSIRTNENKETNVSYIEFEGLEPGDYELASLKFVNNPKTDYANKKDISIPFSLKVFSKNEKIEPIVRIDLNTHMISDNLNDNKEVLIDVKKLDDWFKKPNDDNKDYATISYKPLIELTPQDFDYFLRPIFINQENNYENIEMQYIVENFDRKNKKFDIKVKYIDTKTNKEYTSESLTFHYLWTLDNKQTTVLVFEEFNENVKDWENKLKQKIETINFDELNEEGLEELVTTTISDLPSDAKTKIEFVKNKDKTISLKIYSDKVYFNNYYFNDLKEKFLLAEIKINYFKN